MSNLVKFLLQLVVEMDGKVEDCALEGDREITEFLEEQSKRDGNFVSLVVKKLVN